MCLTGQLGSSAHYFDHATPQLVDVVSGAKIESVSCGWGATVAVDSERQRVWTWGYFRDSEGHKVLADYETFCLCQSLLTINVNH